MRRVAVTGMAITSPMGCKLGPQIEAWLDDAAFAQFQELPNFSDAGPVRFGGFCSEIDLGLIRDHKIKKSINRRDLIGISTALSAARVANVEGVIKDATRFGIFVGASSTQIGDLSAYFDLCSASHDERSQVFGVEHFGRGLMTNVSPLVMFQTLMNNIICHVSVALNIQGPNANFVEFQTSGAKAVIAGAESIRDGLADMCLVGAAGAQPEPYYGQHAVRMGYLADTSNCVDAEASRLIRPFDADACGSILSEGSAFLVLEDLDHACRRGAKVYGEISDWKQGCDGLFFDPTVLRSKIYAQLLEDLWRRNEGAGDLVFSCTNASPYMDAHESFAIDQAAQRTSHDGFLHAHSSFFGDMSEASAVAGVILGLTSLSARKLGATRNCTNPTIQGLRVGDRTVSIKAHTKMASICVRSFAGNCAAICIGSEG